jgi:hypothetical protein
VHCCGYNFWIATQGCTREAQSVAMVSYCREHNVDIIAQFDASVF